MSKDVKDFLGKIEWEGGVYEAIEYGVDERTYELPAELKEHWRALRVGMHALQAHVRFIERLLEEYEGDAA